jgi:uncharacterized damage-inducible protein DinB
MKQYLIDFFKYNDWANRQLLESFKQLPDKEEPVILLSHIIAAQNRWLNRITQKADDGTYSWSGPAIPADQLESRWTESINRLIHYFENIKESDLESEIVFQRPTDKKMLRARLCDIALQLNYHSLQHRAQINRIIRLQGQTPPATDYIYTVVKDA